MWDVQSDEVNKSVVLFPVFTADGILFSVHVNNLKILSKERVTLRGCFVVFPPFLHITTCTPTQKTHLISSHIFQKL